MIVPGSKKAVLRGPFGNFEVLNGPVLQIFFRTGPKGPEVRWYTMSQFSKTKLREPTGQTFFPTLEFSHFLET